MTLEDLIKENASAKERVQFHAEQMQRWIGVQGWTEQQIEKLKQPEPLQPQQIKPQQ